MKNKQTRTWVLILGIWFLVHDLTKHTLGANDFPSVYKYYIANSIMVTILTLFSFTKPLTEKEKQFLSNKHLDLTSRIKLKLRNMMKPHLLVKLALQLCIIRCIIRLFDFEDSSQEYQKKGYHVHTILFYTIILRLCIELYIFNNNNKTILCKMLGFIYIFIGIESLLTEKYIKYE